MQQGLIGVIVPVYKVEKYIAECIESILAQTYTKFRLILVDDGTPDNAGKICDEYAKKDSRIIVIHQENAGVTRARARGVEEATDCEFITFVDGDDTIHANALQELIQVMTKDADIVLGAVKGYNYELEDKITSEEYLHLLISRSCISPAPWAKLIRRRLFTSETFNIPREIVYGEDLLMNVRIAFNSRNVNILKKYIYNYRTNSSGCEMTFKTCPEYESAYFKEMLTAIPEKKRSTYYMDTIKRRILIIEKEICYKCRIDRNWLDSDFNKLLLHDIKAYGFEYSSIKTGLLKTQSPVLRFLMITILKAINIYKKHL